MTSSTTRQRMIRSTSLSGGPPPTTRLRGPARPARAPPAGPRRRVVGGGPPDSDVERIILCRVVELVMELRRQGAGLLDGQTRGRRHCAAPEVDGAVAH